MKTISSVSLAAFVLLLCTSSSWGQSNPSQQSLPGTPPPSADQQDPSTIPSQTPGQQPAPGIPGVPAAAQAQKIQDALRKQMPASADGVVVTTLSDNRIQLNGTASSEQEKRQIEQVAHSAAPDLVIVNSINVANPPYPPEGAKSEPPPRLEMLLR